MRKSLYNFLKFLTTKCTFRIHCTLLSIYLICHRPTATWYVTAANAAASVRGDKCQCHHNWLLFSATLALSDCCTSAKNSNNSSFVCTLMMVCCSSWLTNCRCCHCECAAYWVQQLKLTRNVLNSNWLVGQIIDCAKQTKYIYKYKSLRCAVLDWMQRSVALSMKSSNHRCNCSSTEVNFSKWI